MKNLNDVYPYLYSSEYFEGSNRQTGGMYFYRPSHANPRTLSAVKADIYSSEGIVIFKGEIKEVTLVRSAGSRSAWTVTEPTSF